MKRLLVILVLGLLFPFVGYSQDVNLEKLSPAEREKKLFEIAIVAMKEYAPSYYKEDINPVLGHKGPISWEKDRYFGKIVYSVRFPFDLRKAIGDGKEGENVYGGSVVILAETGKAISILPTGWVTMFDIDKANEARTRSGQHKVAEPTKVPKNPFKK